MSLLSLMNRLDKGHTVKFRRILHYKNMEGHNHVTIGISEKGERFKVSTQKNRDSHILGDGITVRFSQRLNTSTGGDYSMSYESMSVQVPGHVKAFDELIKKHKEKFF